MTTWKEIGKDGPPPAGEYEWVWRIIHLSVERLRRAYHEWWHESGWHVSIEPTDQWTPIVPPDPPEED